MLWSTLISVLKYRMLLPMQEELDRLEGLGGGLDRK
jgi:hypothetical protein